MKEHASDHVFAGSVRLRVRGSGRVLRHFAAEYGPVAPPAGPAHPGHDDPPPAGVPDVEVAIRFGTRLEPLPGGTLLVGGHKTARWRVALGPPDHAPLRASIALAGGPPSIALSLVQGYFVEALVAVALARAGRVALPSAGFVTEDGATVLLGRSGTGKTTLTARALAAGRTVLSDDQVVIDSTGCVWRYPRRLRFYPDIRETAPEAWALLRPGTRTALVRRGTVRRMTRGYVAPSLAVPASEIGGTVEDGALLLQRIVIVDRAALEELTTTPRDPAWVVQQAGLVLADQRDRLSRDLGGAWAAALDAALAAEQRTLTAALAGVPATEVVVPRAWDARRSVDALDAHLGLTSGRAAPPAVPPPTHAR